MEDRNKLFRKMHGLLVNEGASSEEARQLVKEEFRRSRPSEGKEPNTPKTLLSLTTFVSLQR